MFQYPAELKTKDTLNLNLGTNVHLGQEIECSFFAILVYIQRHLVKRRREVLDIFVLLGIKLIYNVYQFMTLNKLDIFYSSLLSYARFSFFPTLLWQYFNFLSKVGRQTCNFPYCLNHPKSFPFVALPREQNSFFISYFLFFMVGSITYWNTNSTMWLLFFNIKKYILFILRRLLE